MPKVSIYTRATTGGSRRRYSKATRGSTGPFFLRYEINGKRVWESIHTRTYTFALASHLVTGDFHHHAKRQLHFRADTKPQIILPERMCRND
jgi:hypothetical protein